MNKAAVRCDTQLFPDVLTNIALYDTVKVYVKPLLSYPLIPPDNQQKNTKKLPAQHMFYLF